MRSYRNAPMGARSKREGGLSGCEVDLTGMPRWGRDQNSCDGSRRASRCLPECPDRGEIKTHRVADLLDLLPYRNAPMGARSKLGCEPLWLKPSLTGMPRWGRDQNTMNGTRSIGADLPECPDGGEIKTGWDCETCFQRPYRNAPMGACRNALSQGALELSAFEGARLR